MLSPGSLPRGTWPGNRPASWTSPWLWTPNRTSETSRGHRTPYATTGGKTEDKEEKPKWLLHFVISSLLSPLGRKDLESTGSTLSQCPSDSQTSVVKPSMALSSCNPSSWNEGRRIRSPRLSSTTKRFQGQT